MRSRTVIEIEDFATLERRTGRGMACRRHLTSTATQAVRLRSRTILASYGANPP